MQSKISTTSDTAAKLQVVIKTEIILMKCLLLDNTKNVDDSSCTCVDTNFLSNQIQPTTVVGSAISVNYSDPIREQTELPCCYFVHPQCLIK